MSTSMVPLKLPSTIGYDFSGVVVEKLLESLKKVEK